MHMTPQCRQRILEPSEGLRLSAYRDCVGVWTLGYGHTSKAGKPYVVAGQKITQAQADQILADDLGVFENGVTGMLHRVARPCEFDAMCDLAFNIGLGNLKSSSLLRYFNAGNRIAAADAFLTWNRAAGRVIGGLTTRRQQERAWYLDQAPGEAPEAPVGFAGVGQFDIAHDFHDQPDSALERARNLTTHWLQAL